MSSLLKPKRRRKSASNSILIFVLALIIFILAFGAVGLWFVQEYVHQHAGESSGGTSGSTELEWDESDAFDWLLVLTNEDAVDALLRCRFDPAAGAVSVTALPGDTAVTVGGETVRLSSLYGDGSRAEIEQLQAAAAGAYRCTFERYAVLSAGGLAALIDAWGDSLMFTVPQEIVYSSETTYLHLQAGTQTLSSSQVTGLLELPDSAWSGGKEQAETVRASLIAALYNQYETAEQAAAETHFKALVNQSRTTDLLISDYYRHAQAIAYLSELNTGSLCTAALAEGDFVGTAEDRWFYPAE